MDIEQLKADLLVKHLNGTLNWDDIEKLPVDDSIRTFLCELDPEWSHEYASCVDKGPCDETRTGACKSSFWAYCYATYVDRKPTDETREAAYKDPYSKDLYLTQFEEYPN